MARIADLTVEPFRLQMLELFVGSRFVWERIAGEGKELWRSALALGRVFSLNELPPFVTDVDGLKDQNVSRGGGVVGLQICDVSFDIQLQFSEVPRQGIHAVHTRKIDYCRRQ